MNLLKETIEKLAEVGMSETDIAHIGNSEYGCSWEEFEELANVEYDSGFGASEVTTDLIIVFHTGSYLSREEYDGSEWWEASGFHKKYEGPFGTKKIKRIKGDLWPRLKELNSD